jgi:ATP-dependent helicase/nuclease subunit B
MKTYLLSPRLSLVDEIADELVCEGPDFSGNLVVFPGKRPAHYLRKAVAARTGGAHLPPVILSMDEFVDRAFESVDERPKLDPLDAVALLYDIHCSMNQRIGGKDFSVLDSFFSVGLKLYHDLEELVIEQISPDRIRGISALAEETIPELSNQRIASLEFFYERFYKKIQQEGLSTRSVRYRTVAERLEETDTHNYIKIIFAGFFALTLSEKMIFRKLDKWENVSLYFQDGPYINEILSQLEVAPEKREAEEGFPSVGFMSSPDTHGQVFALADMIKPMRDKGGIDENIAVVLPSAGTLFPLLRHGLPDFNEREFNISIGYPLSRTPLFGFVRELMELITGAADGRIHIAEYLAFALHPYTKNIYFNGSAETTRIIFHAVEAYYAQRPSKSFITLDEIESDKNLVALIMKKLPEDLAHISETDARNHIREIHNKTLRPFFEILNVTDFSLKLVGLLSYVAGQSTAKLHPLFMPFCEAFIEALELIAKSRLGEKRFEERTGYFTLFTRYLMTRRAPFEGTPLRGLQALGILETRNIRFDRVFLLDANEDILPDTKREDSLIPGAARELLGLSTYRDRDRLAAYYFDVLIKGASDVNIFFVESSQREKSRFVEKILWETQQRKGSIKEDRAVRNLQYRVDLVNPDPATVCKSAEIAEFLRGLSYSASSIDTYLACPLKFYYRYALKLTEKEEAGEGIERSDIGIIVHRALADYFGQRLGRPLTERDINANEITERVKGIFEESYGGVPTGSGYLIMKQIQKRLADYLGNYLTPLLPEEMTMIEAEADMKAPFHDFRLRGRIDAAQKREGRIYILDYKTSANKSAYKIAFDKLDPYQRETWSAIGSMQLPVYRILYSHERKIERSCLNAMFLMLGMAKMNRDIELPLFHEEGGTSAADSVVIEEILLRLLKEITDPAVPFHPTPDKKKNCPICDFTAICGTQWVQR